MSLIVRALIPARSASSSWVSPAAPRSFLNAEPMPAVAKPPSTAAIVIRANGGETQLGDQVGGWISWRAPRKPWTLEAMAEQNRSTVLRFFQEVVGDGRLE